MAANTKTTYHSRSNSSPIETHPFLSQFNDHLLRLQSSEGTSTSKSSISHKLTGLIDLHDHVCNLLQLSFVQQSLTKEHNENLVQGLLDVSLWLIHVCGIVRDVLMLTKEGTQQLQSVLRRRRPNELEISKKVGLYLNSRKMVKKLITKSLGEMKSLMKQFNLRSPGINHETVPFVRILEESQAASIDVFESLFAYILGPSTLSRTCKWSLISKLVQSKEISCEDEDCSLRNKFQLVDEALHMLSNQKAAKSVDNFQIEKLRGHLEELESVATDLESSTDPLSRLLIKSRVTLLNMFNP